MAAKKKEKTRRETTAIKVWVTPAEKAAITVKADAYSLSASTYLRELALRSTRPPTGALAGPGWPASFCPEGREGRFTHFFGTGSTVGWSERNFARMVAVCGLGDRRPSSQLRKDAKVRWK